MLSPSQTPTKRPSPRRSWRGWIISGIIVIIGIAAIVYFALYSGGSGGSGGGGGGGYFVLGLPTGLLALPRELLARRRTK